MKKWICILLLLNLATAFGCAGDSKYINARGVLDSSISYTEKGSQDYEYPLTKRVTPQGGTSVVQVPQPAKVDENSIIEIHIAKEKLKQGSLNELLSKRSEELLRQKKEIKEAVDSLGGVVKARQKALDAYQEHDLKQFFPAKIEAGRAEGALLAKLQQIWPEGSQEYLALGPAYDPPTYAKLQAYLSQQVVLIDQGNQQLEDEVKRHAQTLTLEGFLMSPGKEPVAVHLDGYDLLKEGSLTKRDRFGLDLSPDELKRLNDHVKETQELAAALERLRTREATLSQTVQQMQTMMTPQVNALLTEGDRLLNGLSPAFLKSRTAETKKDFDAFLEAIKAKENTFYGNQKQQLEKGRDTLADGLALEGNTFLQSLKGCVSSVTAFKQDWQKTSTPQDMLALIKKTDATVKTLVGLGNQVPEIISDAKAKAKADLEAFLNGLPTSQIAALLQTEEGQALLADLAGYYQDFKDVWQLIQNARAVLGSSQLTAVAEMPSASASLEVPVNDIKDTFINLQTTPRLPGDTITIRGTLKEGTSQEGTHKVLDTSTAQFEVGRYGYYAELSPAVVLVKPDHLSGSDTGFRFAPVLSWMHHRNPRPEDKTWYDCLFRALDPALGIHSAFTNFRADAGSEAVQIGLGGTISFWKNRLQFGAGFNLMAKNRDQGEHYFFVGSDLIGILQTVGIVKP